MAFKKFDYAGFRIRLLAWIIDFLIIAFIWWILLELLSFIDIWVYSVIEYHMEYKFIYTFVLFSRPYYAFFESSSFQWTLWKLLFWIKVVDIKWEKIPFLRSTGRHFSKILSTLFLFFWFIVIAFDSKKQWLHDTITWCLVIKK